MQKQRNIANYFIADIISQLGSNIAFLALHWYIIEQTNSSQQIGVAVSLSVIAGLITCPFAGILADIFSRKSILIYSNYLRAFFISAILLLMHNSEFHIQYLYVLFIISGIGFNIYIPAAKAFLQEIIQENDAVRYSGFLEVNVQISLLVAGGLSGILYKLYGIYWILAFNVATFILASFLLLSVKSVSTITNKINPNIFREFSDGITYFVGHRIILYFMIIMLLPHIVTIAQHVVLPGYVMNYLDSDSITYGMFSMVYGIGATIISIIYILNSEIYSEKYLLYLSFCLSMISIFAMIFYKSTMISFIAMFFFGFANSSIKITLICTMMRIIDKEFMGRVISVKNMVITLLQMFFSYQIGYMMDRHGDLSGFIILEMIMIVSFVLYLLNSNRFNSLLKN